VAGLKALLLSPQAWRHNVEIASVLLLSIATVFTAWSAYQATRWSGVQSKAYNEMSIARIDSSREFTMAAQNFTLDTIVFTLWADAYAAGNDDLAAFLKDRVMVEAFLPVLDAWLASEPLTNPDSLSSPMEDSEYRARLLARSQQLEAIAETRFQDAMAAYENIDSYVLTTVICAVVLFFAGIAPKFDSVNVQRLLLSGAMVMLLIAVANLIRLPVQ
jgi:hypothetical protein